ncbi:MAG: LytTR family transcriptional regulator [Bacteroidales bacterium]|nr:LytTR family transcriptional regulator [Bacteroidales bacterium]
MFLKDKIPGYLLGKYQLIGTITFSVLFAVVFLNIYIPFSDTAWFGLGDSVMFLMTIVFIAVAILSLIASRLLMYHIKKYFDINYLEYILWCTLEIVTICGLYTGITMSIDLPAGETILKVFGRSLLYGTIALGVPYLISGMYFAIIDKNNTIRLMSYENVVTDEPVKPESQMNKITLFDNSGSLKLSLNPDSLYYIESDDNYIKVWYTDSKGELKQYMLRCRLKTVEESFKGVGLVRCNRKYIVNINKVATLRKESEGYILDLANEAIQPLPVTKTYTDNVLSYFTEVQPLLDPIEE